jgi:uncharacterized membrane protein
MKQQEYINQLRRQLSALPKAEVDDIIRDQEEFIRDAVASGRSEETVVQGLGDPKTLGQSLVAQFRIEHAQVSDKFLPKARNTWHAVIAFMALAPLNIFIILVPFSMGLSMLAGFWFVEFVCLFAVGVAYNFFFKQMVDVAAGTSVHLSSFFLITGTGAALIALAIVLGWLSKQFLSQTLRYLNWNLKLMNQLGAANEKI